MNCEQVSGNIPGLISGTLCPADVAGCRRHLAGCRECTEALAGAQALDLLKVRDTGIAPRNLFDNVLDRLDEAREPRRGGRFWLGAAFGGAVAASLIAMAFGLGRIEIPSRAAPDVPEFQVVLGEPRNMALAIETDRPLQDARISIMLDGGVELEGYGERRELTWTSDLKAGLNRLSLPVVAVDRKGGRLVVRLSHPQSEQLFVIRLRTGA